MKVKTSITLSAELIKAIDKLLGDNGNRSDLVEKALRAYLLDRERQIRDARDLFTLNQHAEKLNKEARDVLSYQVKL